MAMVEEFGTVQSVDGPVARVLVPRKSACEGCTMGVCKAEDQAMEIEAFNPVGAQAGQKVRISIASVTYLKGTMIVYGLPAVFLVLGAVAGKELVSRIITHVDSDVLSAICGFSAFLISFLLVKLWSHSASRDKESRPVIEEIVQ